MTEIPLQYAPGCCKVDSPYAAKGRYTDMNLCRFIAGKPEKLGGVGAVTGNSLEGAITSLQDWRTNAGVAYLGIGTTQKLYYRTTSTEVDITPLRYITTSTLTNPLTTNATTTVSVAHTAHGLSTGDYVQLVSTVAIDGVTLGNSYYVTVTNANAYTIQVPVAATGSTSSGGGTVTYKYPRATLGNNPFTTTSGSSSVVVTHNNHGASDGDRVYWTGGTTVGGINLTTGDYQIHFVTTNNYTVFTSTTANANVTGGGASVVVEYGITFAHTNIGGLWTLSPYGQQLLACAYGAGIYVFDPTVGGRAYPLYNAPTDSLAMLVTPERFVFSIGQTSAPMKVAWADQTSYNIWTPAVTNTANNRTLQEGSYLVSGITIRDELVLIFSNTACYTFAYTGDTFVYKSQVSGKECGLISPANVCVAGGIAYWWSGSDFWTWNSTPVQMPSDDIRDYVIVNFSPTSSQTWSEQHIAKKEIWFGFPANYVIYHIDQNCWSIGSGISITAYLDMNLFPFPVIGVNSILYYAENGTDLSAIVTDNPYVTFAPMDISSGDKNMDIFSFIPDFERQTQNNYLVINTQQYPNDVISVAGTYVLSTNTTRVDFRIGAKLIGGKIGNNVSGGDFRIGLPRVEVQPAGSRR